MNKSLLAAALCVGLATAGNAQITVSALAGPGTDLANIFVGDNFELDITATGPLGESIVSAGGNVFNSGNITFTGYDVGNYSDDLSTVPLIFKLYYSADAVGPATFSFNFAFIDTNVASYSNLDSNRLIFAVLAPAAAPEPASWAMMLAGFGAVGYGLRRRKSAVSFA